MCFGPSLAERQMAEQQRITAAEAKQASISERAEAKRDDVSEALTGRNIQQGRRGGAGRRSLLTSPMGGAGYASRF
jgi:hypothetical protein